ncbi:hypothetical protein QTN25_008016 [Entamoeba marina]
MLQTTQFNPPNAHLFHHEENFHNYYQPYHGKFSMRIINKVLAIYTPELKNIITYYNHYQFYSFQHNNFYSPQPPNETMLLVVVTDHTKEVWVKKSEITIENDKDNKVQNFIENYTLFPGVIIPPLFEDILDQKPVLEKILCANDRSNRTFTVKFKDLEGYYFQPCEKTLFDNNENSKFMEIFRNASKFPQKIVTIQDLNFSRQTLEEMIIPDEYKKFFLHIYGIVTKKTPFLLDYKDEQTLFILIKLLCLFYQFGVNTPHLIITDDHKISKYQRILKREFPQALVTTINSESRQYEMDNELYLGENNYLYPTIVLSSHLNYKFRNSVQFGIAIVDIDNLESLPQIYFNMSDSIIILNNSNRELINKIFHSRSNTWVDTKSNLQSYHFFMINIFCELETFQQQTLSKIFKNFLINHPHKINCLIEEVSRIVCVPNMSSFHPVNSIGKKTTVVIDLIDAIYNNYNESKVVVYSNYTNFLKLICDKTRAVLIDDSKRDDEVNSICEKFNKTTTRMIVCVQSNCSKRILDLKGTKFVINTVCEKNNVLENIFKYNFNIGIDKHVLFMNLYGIGSTEELLYTDNIEPSKIRPRDIMDYVEKLNSSSNPINSLLKLSFTQFIELLKSDDFKITSFILDDTPLPTTHISSQLNYSNYSYHYNSLYPPSYYSTPTKQTTKNFSLFDKSYLYSQNTNDYRQSRRFSDFSSQKINSHSRTTGSLTPRACLIPNKFETSYTTDMHYPQTSHVQKEKSRFTLPKLSENSIPQEKQTNTTKDTSLNKSSISLKIQSSKTLTFSKSKQNILERNSIPSQIKTKLHEMSNSSSHVTNTPDRNNLRLPNQKTIPLLLPKLKDRKSVDEKISKGDQHNSNEISQHVDTKHKQNSALKFYPLAEKEPSTILYNNESKIINDTSIPLPDYKRSIPFNTFNTFPPMKKKKVDETTDFITTQSFDLECSNSSIEDDSLNEETTLSTDETFVYEDDTEVNEEWYEVPKDEIFEFFKEKFKSIHPIASDDRFEKWASLSIYCIKNFGTDIQHWKYDEKQFEPLFLFKIQQNVVNSFVEYEKQRYPNHSDVYLTATFVNNARVFVNQFVNGTLKINNKLAKEYNTTEWSITYDIRILNHICQYGLEAWHLLLEDKVMKYFFIHSISIQATNKQLSIIEERVKKLKETI